MNFFSKHVLKIEIVISLLLLVIVFISIFSQISLFNNLGNSNGSVNSFDTIWMVLYWLNFLVYQIGYFGFLINLLFYTALICLAIFGFILKRNKKIYWAVHIFLIITILGHLVVFQFLYQLFRNLMSV